METPDTFPLTTKIRPNQCDEPVKSDSPLHPLTILIPPRTKAAARPP